MPESPSDEPAVMSKLPLLVGRNKTVLPTAEVVPVKLEKPNVGAEGSDGSTLTVWVTEALLPTWSVPVSVWRWQRVGSVWAGVPAVVVGEPYVPHELFVSDAEARVSVDEARPDSVADCVSP